jgi:hypothetical protein
MASKILDILNNATEADLDAVIERRKEIRKEDETLSVLEKALSYKFNGKPERAKPQKKKADGGIGTNNDLRERVGKFLLIRGNCKPQLIAAELNVHGVSVYHATKHEWFLNTPDGVALSQSGKEHFG